jgi:isocitrate/isopropylmalate dehydrogenase
MFEFLQYHEVGAAIENAVRRSIVEGQVTRDLGGNLKTEEVAVAVAERISG